MKLLKVLFVLSVICMGHISHSQWQRVEGFNEGTVKSLTTTESHVFAATSSGIYRTSDPATGWQLLPINDATYDVKRILDLGDAIFVTSEKGGNGYRSTDQGDTWTPVEIGSNIDITWFARAGQLYIATGDLPTHRFVSNDGISWTQASSEAIDLLSSIAYIDSDETYIYILSGWPSKTIRRTTDMVNFESLLSDLTSDSFVLSDGVLFASEVISESDALFVSTDQGDSWQIQNGLPSGTITTSSTLSALNQNGVWIVNGGFIDYGIHVSTDEGASWSTLGFDGSALALKQFIEFEGGIFGFSDYTTVLQFTFAETTFSVTSAGNGLDLSRVNKWVSSDDNFYGIRYYDGFVELNSGISTPDVSPQFEGTGIQPAINREYIDFPSGAMFYASGGNPMLFVKTNGANSFTDITGNLFSIQGGTDSPHIIGDMLLTFNNFGVLYASENFGQTWEFRGPSDYNTTLPIFRKANRLYGFSTDNVSYALHYTEDFGNSYVDVGESPIVAPTFASANDNRIMVTNQTQRAISDDDGATWNYFENNELMRFTRVHNSPATILALSDNPMGVYVSHDLGETFTEVTTEGLPPSLFNMYFVVSSEEVGIYRPSGDLYRISRASLQIPTTATNIEQQEHLKCYPNPASDQLYFQAVSERTQVSVFDQSGKCLYDHTLITGDNQVNLSHLPDGMYVLKLIGLESGIVKTARVVVMK